MKLTSARVVMAVALRCFGDRRQDWAQAMAAEFDVAAEAGEPLSFATGCLTGALREMPVHEEGRFAIANHLLAVGVIIPIAVLLLVSVASGNPFMASLNAGAVIGSSRPDVINVANRTGLPLLALLTVVLGAGHLCMAWAMLDRDWLRVTSMGFAGAALATTVLILAAIFFIYDACALPQTMVTVLELSAIWSLVRWHADLPENAPVQSPIY